MTQLMTQHGIVTIRDIFHSTDFSPPPRAAFAHALKLTIGMRADLTIMHVDSDRADADFYEFPRVRGTLARWGLLPKDSCSGSRSSDFYGSVSLEQTSRLTGSGHS